MKQVETIALFGLSEAGAIELVSTFVLNSEIKIVLCAPICNAKIAFLQTLRPR